MPNVAKSRMGDPEESEHGTPSDAEKIISNEGIYIIEIIQFKLAYVGLFIYFFI